MRRVRDAGFEVGIHCYDHTYWQDFVARRGPAWTRRQMLLAVERFREVFGTEPAVHGAAGWQMNETALALEQEFGFLYASDTRGVAPFVPLLGGQRSRCPQLPTTLPTLDELIGVDGIGVERVHEPLLARTREPCAHHVFTLHAELEGMKLLPVLRRLLSGWLSQGYQLVSMRTLLAGLDVSTLPAGVVQPGTVPGRSGLLAVQAAVQPV
jgi:peptidoglycan/xylan/chitin deacetylase (PgdA/CDA1 family)